MRRTRLAAFEAENMGEGETDMTAYTLRAGALYREDGDIPLARLKNVFPGNGKQIVSADGRLLLKAEIRGLAAGGRQTGDVRCHAYVLLDPEGREEAEARPDYVPEQAPEREGWSPCHLPQVDRAQCQIHGRCYLLQIRDGRDYRLSDCRGQTAVQITHRGLAGGWDLKAEAVFSPALLCGMFAFCRYIERENELTIV